MKLHWIALAALGSLGSRCPVSSAMLPDCQGTRAANAPDAPLDRPFPRLRVTFPAREAAAHATLRVDADVPIPGPTMRFDDQSVDTANNRLYISQQGAVVVFDLETEQIIHKIHGLPGVTGVLAVPELGKVYASLTDGREVAVIDDATLEVTARVRSIGSPTSIAYSPTQRKIYVSDESGGGELVIDGVSNRVVRRIPLGGEAGNTIYDPVSRCIVVAVTSTNQVVAIDPFTDRVIGRYSPPGASRPHGLSLDVTGRRLFIANRGNSTLSIVDLNTLSVIAQPIGINPDALAFDPGWRRLYVASESGVVSVLTETEVGLAFECALTMPYAHTVAVDPRTHLAYFPLQDVAGRAVLRIMSAPPPFPAGRGTTPFGGVPATVTLRGSRESAAGSPAPYPTGRRSGPGLHSLLPRGA